MENQDIDKMFNDAGKSAEEKPTFPNYEKVWKNVEEKLDRKEQKKRIIPLWFPYGMVAGLALTFGVLYFMKDDKVQIEHQIASKDYGKTINPNQIETTKNVEEINKTFEENLSNNPINTSENGREIMAHHDVEPKKDEFDDLYNELKEKYKTEDIQIKKDENGKISASVNNQSDVNTQGKRFQGLEIERKKNDEIFSKAKTGHITDEKYIKHVESGNLDIPLAYQIKPAETPPPAIAKKLETAGKLSDYIAYTPTAAGIKTKESIDEVLNGRVAGLSFSPSVGTPGSSPIVKIRGISSMESTKEPLYIVDGKVESSKILASLNPKTIESVKILKDASATSLYGSRGINGVILINTKNLSKKEIRRLNRQFKMDSKDKVENLEKLEEKLPDAGKLTAGEVNDFSKWDYWQDIAVPILDQYKKTWKFFPDKRVSVQLVNFDNNPIIGKKLKLIDDKKEVIWESITDNRGNAELWISSLIDQKVNLQQYSIIDEDGNILSNNAKEFRNGQNLIKINNNCIQKRPLELVFVVDATGSMGDEINYLKSELLDVLKKVESNLKNTNIRYGSVFYRDNGDEYVTRKFDFSNDAENLINFIKNQKADGGGDTPEAVVEALESSIDELYWSKENSTKLMFLLLDAPPHLSDVNIEKLNQKIKLASKKGITIIPIAASDTDKQTEYLMRTFALLTNGTYTFLTNDSGIGNNHIKPTASAYEVEKLNDLLLRLILQRSTVPDCKNGVTKEYINKKLEVESLDKKDFSTKIYPNPTKGIFKIDTKRDIEEFTLYDYAGKILMKKNNLVKGSNSFDISAYPQSVYLVRLKYGTESETFKIIKN